MRKLDQFYINGAWVDPAPGSTTHDIVNPATEAVIGTLAMGTVEDVERSVSAARAAFPAWSATSRETRAALLSRAIELYEARLEAVGEAIHEEIGAPRWLAATRHAPLGPMLLKSAREALEQKAFSERIGNTEVVCEPIGVAALITPWNWPAAMVAAKVGYALAAGCTAVLKPSEISPLDALLFAQILHEAGVPAGVFNMVYGEGPIVGAALARHPGVDVISITGSTRAGSQVAADAAPTLKRVTQELGGKSPNVILDDADLDTAVAHGVMAVMINSGQTCIAPTRMLVPRALHARVVEIAQAAAAQMKVGAPEADNVQVGPVASRAQFDKVQRMIRVGIEEGALLVAGGPGRPDGLTQGFFVRPTIFANVSNSARIAREEIFGPVLTIIPYDSEEEAITIANDTEYGLAAYVWSSDPARARRVAARLRAGTVGVNGANADPGAPFGGYKRSGNGRELGVHGLAEYLEYKSIAL
ncbi:aldehyde dehydrogenase family protein [Burkholderia anthina]|uniref:aldehyde dehydrogenase family protein n=1 Tax=Burkholderia anthina TaxID=179879 RepID=UPI001CF58A2B|nr:aldehyde dehydrogenase family protein [Burkholderia anthina]MCA8094868.1 aldehyde dehydrogenase family protein [Burkholderia anthina]